jgi:hypothetical protein
MRSSSSMASTFPWRAQRRPSAQAMCSSRLSSRFLKPLSDVIARSQARTNSRAVGCLNRRRRSQRQRSEW